MGVIFVVHEAMKRGFVNGHPDWSNLGQGQPEIGPMEGAPERIADVHIEPEDHAYGPLEGIPELREAVAAHYNRLYRKGMKSQYSAENVCIAQGGRLALSRAMMALAATSVGYQTPDYTAYEDMFNVHLARIDTHLVRARPEDGFVIPAGRLEQELSERDLGAFGERPGSFRHLESVQSHRSASRGRRARAMDRDSAPLRALVASRRVLQPLHLQGRRRARRPAGQRGSLYRRREP